MARLNKLIIVAGKKGSGKTTIGKRIAAAQKKPIIVVCTIDHPAYRDMPTWQVGDLKKWKGQSIRVFNEKPLDIIREVKKHISNAFILLEDSREYLRGNLPTDIESFVIHSKQRNCDILVMYHSLGQVPLFLRNMYDDIVLLKTRDKKQGIDKFDCSDELHQMHQRLIKSKNPFAVEIIQV